MPRILAAAAAAIVLSAAGSAAAQIADESRGLYLRLDTGWSFSRDLGQDFGDIDVGDTPLVGGGVGYRLNRYLRGDLTLSYRGGYEIEESGSSAGVSASMEGDVSALTGMASLYADAPKLLDMVTPYVGGGIGVSRNSVDDLDISTGGATIVSIDGDSKTSFAWQVGAGLGVDVAPNWIVDLGYRYVDLGEVQTGDTVTVGGVSATGGRSTGDLTAHEIQLGVRYQF